METVEGFLERVASKADELGVYLKPPLPEGELSGTAERIRRELGLMIPEDYLRLLRVTNGVVTQRGYLSPLREIGEQNAVIWFMRSTSGTNAQGHFEIRYEPLTTPRTPTYLLLGYDGNSAEQVFDLETGEFRLLLGDGVPLNRDRSLVGLLKHMICGDPAESCRQSLDGSES